MQEYNPRSGLAQSGMVAAYCTYLIVSAVSNHEHQACNPLRKNGTRTTTVVLGAIFTFLAIAYSTSRAATQSRALAGKGKKGGAVQLRDDDDGHAELGVVNAQPGRMESPRYQALLAAVEAGYVPPFDVYFCELIDQISDSAIPASALNEEDEEEEEEELGETRDDERSGTRYNV